MTITRLKILKYYFTNKKNNVSLLELTRFLFKPSYSYRAKKIVRSIIDHETYKEVYFFNNNSPLYIPNNFSIHSLNQVVCECFYSDNWHFYDIPQTRIDHNDILLDCGAAEGLFSFINKKKCKKIYLIEPAIEFHETLKKTFNDNPNITLLTIALSNTIGNVYMSDRGISSQIVNEESGAKIAINTIDNLFYEKDIKITYIKADLEGYDLKALQGASKTIKKYSPKIAITTYHEPEHANEIRKLILSINPEYKILIKGISQYSGCPIMLHAWIDK
jgi:FkbM family methyltransferase